MEKRNWVVFIIGMVFGALGLYLFLLLGISVGNAAFNTNASRTIVQVMTANIFIEQVTYSAILIAVGNYLTNESIEK